MASLRALWDWCRATCAAYPGVDIRDMSSSFRDGLAFCAIIHKHRPGLIDFSSLSKVNAYENNRLAFEVAEAKLGIAALLDPSDVVSCQEPDCLSIISYVFLYYCLFSSSRPDAGPASLPSSHITRFSCTKTQRPDGLRPVKGSAHLETVCTLCLEAVHLIQRLLVGGRIYHRTCFRCKVCDCSLLPDLYTQGGDAGALICIHHTINGKRVGSAPHESKCKFEASFVSLSGLAIGSIPHYAVKTQSQDKPVCETAKTEMKDSRETSREEEDEGWTGEGGGREQQGAPPPGAELPSESPGLGGGSRRPVPAPRRVLDSASAPVPAPRVKTAQTGSGPAAGTQAGNATSQVKSPPVSPHSVNPKVKTSHPWLGIIHPGPWTQLPPAPPPVAPPRSRSFSNLQGPWYRPRVAPPNPFGELLEAETREDAAKQEPPVCSGDAERSDDPPDKPAPPKRRESANAAAASSEGAGCRDRCSGGSLPETQDTLPRSVSVPALTSAPRPSSTEPGDESVTSEQSKQASKDKPLNPKPAVPKSSTFQALPSQRTTAPGHGFPLIKRKVQADQTAPTGDLQVELGELNKQLEVLERRGVELEKNLRDNKSSSQRDEERMLMEWFGLIHRRHVLVRRDTELVYLRKQQTLEEDQADVEYELRCLLNKPESDWSPEDRKREQQLMDELVGIIEQRNQIVSSLDQDRQRERNDDELWETMMKSKELQEEGLKEMKKSRGKSKPPKVFKMLSHKAESIKRNVDKKS